MTKMKKHNRFLYLILTSSIILLNSCEKLEAPQQFVEDIQLIFPKNNLTNADTSLWLHWKGDNSKLYNVYLDTINPPSQEAKVSLVADSTYLIELSYSTTYYWQVKSFYGTVNSGKSDVWSFTTSPSQENLPIPHTPSPKNGEIIHEYGQILEWKFDEEVRYDVYFDTQYPPLNLIGENIGDKWRHLNGLRQNTTYYWQVVVKFPDGRQKASDVWSFTNSEYEPPVALYGMYPANNAVEQPLDLTVSWRCSVRTENGQRTRHTLYIGNSNPPDQELQSVQSGDKDLNYITLLDLDLNQKYYWRIITRYPNGEIYEGPVFSFTTINSPEDVFIKMPDAMVRVKQVYQYYEDLWSKTVIDTLNELVAYQINPSELDPTQKNFSLHNDTLYFSVEKDKEAATGWLLLHQQSKTLDMGYHYDHSINSSGMDYFYTLNKRFSLLFENLPYNEISDDVFEVEIGYDELPNYLKEYDYNYYSYSRSGYQSATTRKTDLDLIEFQNRYLKLVVNKTAFN